VSACAAVGRRRRRVGGLYAGAAGHELVSCRRTAASITLRVCRQLPVGHKHVHRGCVNKRHTRLCGDARAARKHLARHDVAAPTSQACQVCTACMAGSPLRSSTHSLAAAGGGRAALNQVAAAGAQQPAVVGGTCKLHAERVAVRCVLRSQGAGCRARGRHIAAHQCITEKLGAWQRRHHQPGELQRKGLPGRRPATAHGCGAFAHPCPTESAHTQCACHACLPCIGIHVARRATLPPNT
jgi:hypothetical protein